MKDNRKRWPELSERLLIASTYPLGNCGKEGLHDPHIVHSGDHTVWGRIFGPYHCDGNLPRDIFDLNHVGTAPTDWRMPRRNGHPGVPALPEPKEPA